MSATEQNPIVRDVIEGGREARLLAAKGILPLPPSELVPLQVRLSEATDEEIAGLAKASLGDLSPKIAANLVTDGIDLDVVSYFARNLEHPIIVEAVLRRRDVSGALLEEMAVSVDQESQEILLVRQDAILENPAILDALEKNPKAGAYAKRKIHEYREHLLPPELRPRKTKADLEEEADKISEDELLEAIEEVQGAVEATGDDDDLTGLSESQVRSLPIPVRLKLSRGASKGLRNLLIRDPNPMVATSILQNNAMGELEVEQIANSRAVIGEVLELIGKKRNWNRKYSIMQALVRNPRTPVGMAVRMVPRLSPRDMQLLVKDRNVANAVRDTARRLYTMKRR